MRGRRREKRGREKEEKVREEERGEKLGKNEREGKRGAFCAPFLIYEIQFLTLEMTF